MNHVEKCGSAVSGDEKLVNQLISHLKERYRYKAVPITLEYGDVRKIYREHLPKWCKTEGDTIELCTKCGTPVMQGYDRIVIGDYGAFIETVPNKMYRQNICMKKGQEFRTIDPQYTRCKYIWLTARDESDVKIYFQKHTVDYADYVPGKIYISPYELCPYKENEEKRNKEKGVVNNEYGFENSYKQME